VINALIIFRAKVEYTEYDDEENVFMGENQCIVVINKRD